MRCPRIEVGVQGGGPARSPSRRSAALLALGLTLGSGPARAIERAVIIVREGPVVSKYVYVDGRLDWEAAYPRGRQGSTGAGTMPANRPGGGLRDWVGEQLEGLASYYGGGDPFTGSRTASGEVLDDSALTAAHRSLPLHTQVRVVGLSSGRSVVVRINDRGPFFTRRVIDLSVAAARAIGLVERGLARVRLEVVKWPARPPTAR